MMKERTAVLAGTGTSRKSCKRAENQEEKEMEFQKMRRAHQALSAEECREILHRQTEGVLAMDGLDGYPYALPINYVYDEENSRIIFHSAVSGHKIEALKRNPKVSFCVIDEDEIVREKYTTAYSSVIVFGTCRILDSEEEIRKTLELLALHFWPEDEAAHRAHHIDGGMNCTAMIELFIDHLSGKQGKERMKRRQS